MKKASVVLQRILALYRLCFILLCFCLPVSCSKRDDAHMNSDTMTRRVVKVDFSPIRGEVKPLRLRRTGFTYRCNECHQAFLSPRDRAERVAEHTDIQLEHGRNDYCLNCHHRDNREAYVDHNGAEIPSDQPARLCAKCHGIIYRDWLAGAHGKWIGGWGQASEPQQLFCIQCHDPHAPKFPEIEPMPGPNSQSYHL